MIQLHAAVFLWGFTGVLGRTISLNEGLLVWWRLFITVLTLLALRLWQKEFEKIAWKDVLKIVGVGGLVALHWVFFYGSIKYSNVSIALVCLSTIGFFTAFLEPIILRTKLNGVEIMLGLLSMLGIGLIFHFNPQHAIGIGIGLVAALFSAVFSVFNKKLIGRFSAKTLSFYELGGGWLVWTLLLPFYWHFFPAASFFPKPMDWVWLLVLSWLCTVFAINLSFNALKHVSAFTQALTLNLEPVYGIILAFVIYHENKNFNSGFYYGFAIIISVVIIQTYRVSRPSVKAKTVGF